MAKEHSHTSGHGAEGSGPSRRTVMAWGLWALAGIMAASALVPVVELVTRKLDDRKKLKYITVITTDEMPEAGIMKADLNIHGGGKPDTRVFIKRDASGTLTVFSAICTHLGCLVSFNRLKDEFICPCHGGRYNADGVPVAGPPPRPLDRLPVRVVDDDIQAGFYV